MKARTSLFALIAIFLLGSGRVAGQQRRSTASSSEPPQRIYSIRGMVRHASNDTSVEMIRVALKRFTGEEVQTSFTRSAGDFEFAGLSGGSYLLIINEQGFEPVQERVDLDGGSRFGIILFLKPIPKDRPAENGEVISARELALPQKTRDNFRKGMDRLYAKKDFDGSLRFFQKTLSDQPAYYEAYHHMGVAYLELGRMPEAESAFRKSIELSGGAFAPPHFALSGILVDARKLSEAEALIHQGKQIDSQAWQGHYELARLHLAMNHNADAEKCALEARSRKSDYPPLYLLLANIHIRKNDGMALLSDLEEFLRLDPNGPNSPAARQARDALRQKLAQAQQKATNQATFRKLVDDLCAAWSTGDADKPGVFYAKDPALVFYDVTPFEYRGWQEYHDGVKKEFFDKLASGTLTVSRSASPTTKKMISDRMPQRRLPNSWLASPKTNGPMNEVKRSLTS